MGYQCANGDGGLVTGCNALRVRVKGKLYFRKPATVFETGAGLCPGCNIFVNMVNLHHMACPYETCPSCGGRGVDGCDCYV